MISQVTALNSPFLIVHNDTWAKVALDSGLVIGENPETIDCMISTLKAMEVAQAVLAAAASKLEQGKSVEEDLLEVDEVVE